MASDQLMWTDPAGSTLLLSDTDNGYGVAPGRAGFEMPPVELATDTTPGLAGAFLKDVTVGVRAVSIPMTVWAASREELRYKLRDLGARMNPTRGDSTLTVVSLDGTSRQLTVRYVDGLQGAMGGDQRGRTHQRLVVACQALQPYWEDVDPVTRTFTIATSSGWFPIFPLTLGSSAIINAETITNEGDVPAWPVWTISGPGTGLEVSNGTDTLTLDRDIAAGQTVTIDTDARTVTSGGSSLFRYLDPASVFWPLAAGDTSLTVRLGGTTADSGVTLSYRRRWLSA